MTYVPGISQAYTATTQVDKTSQSTQEKTLGQDEFLTLLVAQLQNQDPLNPTDATEFTAQLASYSQLEQLFNLNDSIEQLAEGQENTQRISAMSMIGKEVLVQGETFHLGETGAAEIGYRVDGTASEITIFVKDASGRTVDTLHPTEYGDGNHFITWQGMDGSGQRLPAGKYSLVVQAQASGEGQTVGVGPLVRTEVTGVDLGDKGTMLLTDTGEFSLNDIYGVYEGERQTASSPEDGDAGNQENNSAEVSAATDGSGIIEETGSSDQALASALQSVVGG